MIPLPIPAAKKLSIAMPRSTLDFRGLEYMLVRIRNSLHFRFAPKDEPSRRKLFVIGHAKTGTLTLHTIFVANKIGSSHSAGRWRTSSYDAFADRGNYQPFRLLDRYYSNSWFILNTRPVFNYVRSLLIHRYRERRLAAGPMRARLLQREVETEVLRRNRFFVSVIRHFRDRDNLLVVDIEKPGAFDFLCERIGLSNPGPIWSNRSTSELDRHCLDAITGAFRSLGIDDQKSNPFVIRGLLDASEAAWLRRFLSKQRGRIHLDEHSSPREEGAQLTNGLAAGNGADAAALSPVYRSS